MLIEKDLLETILFLEKYLAICKVTELHQYFPQIIDYKLFSQQLAENKCEIEISHGGFISNKQNKDITEKINQREKFLESLQGQASKLSLLFSTLIKDENILFIGFFPYKPAEIFLIAKQTYKSNKKFAKLQKSNEYKNYKFIVWDDSQEILLNIQSRDTQFKLLNLAIVKNSQQIYQQVIGAMFNSQLLFPNYPMNLLKGIRFGSKIDIPIVKKKKFFNLLLQR